MSESRRIFMTSAAAMTAASYSRIVGANNRIGLGLIGTGGRGTYLMRELTKVDDVQWNGLCDIYDARFANVKKMAPNAPTFAEYRELLSSRDIDAVIVATPDHWHAPMTIDACRAGKDVYVEKPMTTTPQQGLDVCRTVKETKRVVQVGTQQRSGPHYLEAKQKVIDSGLLGRVGLVRCWYNSNAGYLAKPPAGSETKPATLNWDRYLGWLPKMSWDPKRYFNRFAYWDISTGGMTGGLFVHLVDTVNWYLGLDKVASAYAAGGIYEFNDGRDTPDVVTLMLEYPQKLTVTFEAEILTVGIPRDALPTAGMQFHGTNGILIVYRDPAKVGWEFIPKSGPKLSGPWFQAAAEPHLKNWLEAIRKRSKPAVDEVAGHYSAMACHVGNMAYKSRNRTDWSRRWDV